MSENTNRKRAGAEAKAELAYSQALWYFWGRTDSGEFKGKKFRGLPDAFEFATEVKAQTLRFELEETWRLESIQGAFDRYMEMKK